MQGKGRILVVDDEDRLRELLKQFLEGEGYSVQTAENASRAREVLRASAPDLIVMDIMMPGESGIELTRDLRSRGGGCPVLMLSAMGGVQSRIEGLESGADDYLAKPFEPRELVLRIESILKRSSKVQPQEIVQFGSYRLDIHKGNLFRQEERINLTSTELKLLCIFASSPNVPVSREELSRRLNGISERSVDVQVTRLRRRIEEDPKNPAYLQTEWGAGYVLRTRS